MNTSSSGTNETDASRSSARSSAPPPGCRAAGSASRARRCALRNVVRNRDRFCTKSWSSSEPAAYAAERPREWSTAVLAAGSATRDDGASPPSASLCGLMQSAGNIGASSATNTVASDTKAASRSGPTLSAATSVRHFREAFLKAGTGNRRRSAATTSDSKT